MARKQTGQNAQGIRLRRKIMIRDLTKSALSLSWALSLLGAEQAINLLRPGQRNGGNMFAPMTQVAANQLDESMGGLYRTGDNLQRGMVDMAFSLLNPAGWLNPSTWTNMASLANPNNWAGANGGAGRGVASIMNPMNWTNPANFTASKDDCASCNGQSPQAGQATNPSPNGTSGPVATAPVTSEGAVADWGMPSNS